MYAKGRKCSVKQVRKYNVEGGYVVNIKVPEEHIERVGHAMYVTLQGSGMHNFSLLRPVRAKQA